MLLTSEKNKIKKELEKVIYSKEKFKNFPKELIEIILSYVSSFKLKKFKNFEGIYYIDD